MKPGLTCGRYHEGVKTSRLVSSFMLTEIIYAPALKLRRHAHERAGFCLVLQGSYTENYSNKILACKPRTVTFSPAEEQHSNHFTDTGSHCFLVDIDPRWLQRVSERRLRLDKPTGSYGGGLTWLAIRLYKEFQEMDEASELAIEGLILEMVAETSRNSTRNSTGKAPRWLERARELLHDQYLERLSLANVAETVGVHPVYLSSEFHRHYGTTVGEYVRHLRIESACRKLSGSDVPLVEVALTAGFSSQSHFCRTFKRLTGITPAEYRTVSRSS
ncbi:MAG TPA: AraC family transcriptional regulator [Pyrinomonadaceae bacterium]|nr:AraC family transcriptional regulator [Pyrinomonadaceae bacterium]